MEKQVAALSPHGLSVTSWELLPHPGDHDRRAKARGGHNFSRLLPESDSSCSAKTSIAKPNLARHIGTALTAPAHPGTQMYVHSRALM